MATANEHTPGPWVKSAKSKWKIVGEADRRVICEVLPWDVTGCRKEDVDNVHLIAAAPELLEALEKMLQRYGHEMCEYVQLAFAAIAKAKGEY